MDFCGFRDLGFGDLGLRALVVKGEAAWGGGLCRTKALAIAFGVSGFGCRRVQENPKH